MLIEEKILNYLVNESDNEELDLFEKERQEALKIIKSAPKISEKFNDFAVNLRNKIFLYPNEKSLKKYNLKYGSVGKALIEMAKYGKDFVSKLEKVRFKSGNKLDKIFFAETPKSIYYEENEVRFTVYFKQPVSEEDYKEFEKLVGGIKYKWKDDLFLSNTEVLDERVILHMFIYVK